MNAATWSTLARDSGIVSDDGLSSIAVHVVRTCSATAGATDVVLCPPDQAGRRAAAGPSARSVGPERVYMARALGRDPYTAAAMIVRAVIGRWTVARGQPHCSDPHEAEVVRAIDEHLAVAGIDRADIAARTRQIDDRHIVTPVGHRSAVEAAAKAMSQFVRQMAERTAVVFCHGPAACTVSR